MNFRSEELCARGTLFKMQTIFFTSILTKRFWGTLSFSRVSSTYKERSKTFGSGGSDRNGYGCLRPRRCENVTIIENSQLYTVEANYTEWWRRKNRLLNWGKQTGWLTMPGISFNQRSFEMSKVYFSKLYSSTSPFFPKRNALLNMKVVTWKAIQQRT